MVLMNFAMMNSLERLVFATRAMDFFAALLKSTLPPVRAGHSVCYEQFLDRFTPDYAGEWCEDLIGIWYVFWHIFQSLDHFPAGVVIQVAFNGVAQRL